MKDVSTPTGNPALDEAHKKATHCQVLIEARGPYKLKDFQDTLGETISIETTGSNDSSLLLEMDAMLIELIQRILLAKLLFLKTGTINIIETTESPLYDHKPPSPETIWH